MSDPHACCPTCGRCVRCGLDQIPKIEPIVPFKPVDPNYNPPLPGWNWNKTTKEDN